MADTDKLLWCQEGNEMVVLMLTEMTKRGGRRRLPALIRLDFCLEGELKL